MAAYLFAFRYCARVSFKWAGIATSQVSFSTGMKREEPQLFLFIVRLLLLVVCFCPKYHNGIGLLDTSAAYFPTHILGEQYFPFYSILH